MSVDLWPTVSADAAASALPVDQDMDGIPNATDEGPTPEPMVLPSPVSELTNEKVQSVVVQQVKAIKQHKKVVDQVDNDIQVIQQEMKQKRVVDLEALAKHRRWETKPQDGNDLYQEWRSARAKLGSTPMAGPK